MKKDIHPAWKETLVVCNGCGHNFKSHSTVDKITVEICANCHPFYTGKQKLVDIAGRVDKFRAREAAARKPKSKTVPKSVPAKTALKTTVDSTATLKNLKQKLEAASGK